MPRKPVVSRNIDALQVTCLRTDAVKEKMKHESFLIYGNYSNNEQILRKIRNTYDDERFITARIKKVVPVTVYAKTSIQAFIDNAEDIEIKPRKETVQNEQS